MTRGRRGSLALRRRALPSPPPCRFIPAHPLGSTPTAPSRGFPATTSQSASTPRDGTHCLHGFSRSATPSRHPRRQCRDVPSHVPCRAADQAHVAYMPDTAWPEKRTPADSSRANLCPGFDATLMVTTRPQQSPNEDWHRLPSRLTIRAPFLHRSPRQSSANAACGGLPPPPARAAPKGHASISCTAPVKKFYLRLNSLPRSWHTSGSHYAVRVAVAATFCCGSSPVLSNARVASDR